MIKRIALVSLLVAILIFGILPIPLASGAAAWLANYEYRKEITITGGSANVTNYAVKVDVWHSSHLLTYSGSDESAGAWKPYSIGVGYGDADVGYTLYTSNPVIEPTGANTMAKDQCIVQLPTGELGLYYTNHAADDTHSIYLATSDDGITWTNYASNPVFAADGSGFDTDEVARAIIFDEGSGAKRYRMIYMGKEDASPWDALGYAYSADGLSWTREANPWIETGGAGTWDDNYVSSPSNIMQVGATYYTYYSGYDGTKWQIGLLTFTDFEGTITKYASNPVFEPRPYAIQNMTEDLVNATDNLTVTDTSVFEEGEPVWLKDVDSTHHQFTRIASIDSSTEITLEDNADQLYDSGSTITSWMSGSLAWTDIRYETDVWKMTYTAFQPMGVGYDRRVTGYATSEDGVNWVVDYENSPPVEYDFDGGTWDDVHSSDARVFNTDVAEGNYAFIFLDGIPQSDFDDIRFTKADGTTELDYWLETKENGVYATFWVEVDAIELTPAETTIFIYYGYDAATASDNGTNTFEFFDDFDGAALDLAKWDEVNAPTVVVAGGEVSITSAPANNWRAIRTDNTFGAYGRLRASGSIVPSATSANAKNLITLGTTGNAGLPIVGFLWASGGSDFYRTGKVGYTDVAASHGVDGNVHTYQIDWQANSAIFYVDDYLACNTTTEVPAVALNLEGICKEESAPAETIIEWIFFDDDYIVVEPTFTEIGELESIYAIVTTLNATEESTTSAKMNANITSSGNSTVTSRGFDYGETIAYGNEWYESGSYTTGTYSHTQSGLSGDTIYHFRAKVLNDVGWSYGEDKVFITVEANAPTVETYPATNLSETGATLQGALTGLGDYTPVYAYFQYGQTTSYGTSTTEQTMTATGGFSQAVTGLTPFTDYHFRAVVRYAAGGYVYGDDATFRTTSTPGGGDTETEEWFIASGAVFESYITSGDMLFVADVYNTYDPYYPVEDSANYFDFILVGTDNTTLIASVPLVDWGRRPVSIYLSPDMATPITMGDEYILRLSASFDSLTSSYTLQSSDWYGTDLSYLDKWSIRTAHLMELTYDETLVTYVAGRGEVLNTMGGVEFDKGVAGLSYVRPDLFETTVTTPVYIDPTYTEAFEESTDWEIAVGDDVAATMGTVGSLVGIDGRGVLMIIILVAIVLLAFVTRSVFFGMILGTPLAFWGVWVGAIPWVIVGVLGGFMILILGYQLWFKRA